MNVQELNAINNNCLTTGSAIETVDRYGLYNYCTEQLSAIGDNGNWAFGIDINYSGTFIGKSDRWLFYTIRCNSRQLYLELPKGINDAGQVVGANLGEAYIWENNASQDLNDILGEPNWNFTEAEDINNNGWIIGKGTYNGAISAFVFAPPPPAPVTNIGTSTSTACGILDVPVTVQDFENVGGISLVLNYDATKLSFQSIDLTEISGAFVNTATPGAIRISKTPDPAISLADNAELFKLHFNILPAAVAGSTANLVWDNAPNTGNCEYSGPDGNPVYVSTFIDGSATIPVRPVVNTSTVPYTSYCTIQAAIDAATAGDVITVAGGIYAEDIIVDRALTILGPNANIEPCSGTRVTEAIVVPATAAISSGEIIHIAASDVTIKGLTIDGDNPLLTSGFTSTTTADIDAAEGITVYEDNINNTVIQNNIFQNLSYFGVSIFGGSYSAPATSGHFISNNKFQDLGTYDEASQVAKWGGGVLLYNGQYAAVNNNCMTNVRLGIQTGNFHALNPGAAMYQVFDNNTIQARRLGIFYNLHTGNPSALTLSNNTITALSDANETGWKGILMSSLSDVAGIASNNTIDGSGVSIPSSGYEIWNVKSDAPASISGGSVTGVEIGVFANNYEGYSSNAGDGAHATISNITISPAATGTGIRVLDSPSSTTHASVQLTVGSDVIVTGGTNGVVVEGPNATVVSPLGNLALTGQTGKYIQLIDNANDIDATAVSFEVS